MHRAAHQIENKAALDVPILLSSTRIIFVPSRLVVRHPTYRGSVRKLFSSLRCDTHPDQSKEYVIPPPSDLEIRNSNAIYRRVSTYSFYNDLS